MSKIYKIVATKIFDIYKQAFCWQKKYEKE